MRRFQNLSATTVVRVTHAQALWGGGGWGGVLVGHEHYGVAAVEPYCA